MRGETCLRDSLCYRFNTFFGIIDDKANFIEIRICYVSAPSASNEGAVSKLRRVKRLRKSPAQPLPGDRIYPLGYRLCL